MAVCKNCVHYEVCNAYLPRIMKERTKLGDGYTCNYFKSVAGFAEEKKHITIKELETIVNLAECFDDEKMTVEVDLLKDILELIKQKEESKNV